MNLIAEDASPSREEVYEALVRSLRRRKGFGIVFVQCSPAEATRLIEEIQTDLPQKQFANLKFDAPIDNLYDLVTELPNRENLNILFIQGLEKSLEPYIKPGYGGDGDYYTLDTIPTILSHLNQRREVFRDHFHNLCFVFFVPLFAVKYIIRRSPDFYDWSAGIFEFSSDVENPIITKDISPSFWGQTLAITRKISHFLGNDSLNKLGSELYRLGRYKVYINFHHLAWLIRGIALRKLGRYEEAIAAYDRVLEIKPNDNTVWNNRGFALRKLGRYEEAIASYDRALEIKPDLHQAWYNRGFALGKLGRYKEAINSYSKALEIYREIGLREDEADALKELAEIDHLGNLGKAEQYCQQALALATELGMLPLAAECKALQLKLENEKSAAEWMRRNYHRFI